MTGRASPAKAAVGDKPVFAYISSLPQPQRSIAERVDALAADTLPALQRSVKWGMAWYGVGDGWCFSCGGFAGHVKLTFGRGTSLTPVPPDHADRDGQGLARRGPRISGRHRRTPTRVVDETGRSPPRLRRKEAMTDSDETKPLGFSIDIDEILKDVAGTRRKTTRRRTSTTDMDAALRRAVRAELVDVERALKSLATEVVRLRRANEDLADKVAKLTRR